MPSTSNFGWSTPADTDLVKDGALAIRTLGNNIDSSLVDLKGGTTGQILSKNSNSDLDYTWINNDQGDITEVQAGTGISVASGTGPVPVVTNTVATTFDAKGDLVVGTGADTFAKLTTGSNGDTLVADSTTTTGLRWQTNQAAGRNFLTNGSFDIWQRGTSFTGGSASTYSADRWIAFRAVAGSTFSRQTTSDTTNLPFIQYAMRVQRNSGNTATNTIQLVQPLESVNSIPLVGQTVVFSFWARRGANFSAASNNLNVLIQTGTGTDQNNATGFTGSVSIVDTTQALTTTWTRYSFSATVGTTATQVGVQLYYTPVGTAGADDWFEATGLQLELGTVPTRFTRQGGTLAGEYLACARYYQKSYNLGTAPGTDTNDGLNYGAWSQAATTTGWLSYEIVYPVRMRTAATVVTYDVADASGKVSRVTPGGTDQNGVTPSTAFSNEARILVQNSSGNSHAGLALHWTASAEL